MQTLIALIVIVLMSLSCGIFKPQVPDPDPMVQPDPLIQSESPGVPLITLEGLYKEYDNATQETDGITNYLNAGASIDRLQNLLSEVQTATNEPIKAQVIEQDVTGDSNLDLIVSLTLPTIPGYGDTMLAAFTRQNSKYVRYNLFGRTGAGSRGEGLYEGGGARVELVQDLNADDVPEILFYVASLEELYVASWNGSKFVSLVEFTNDLGNPQVFIPVGESFFKVEDTNQDGTLEIVVTDPIAPSVWTWTGTHFQSSDE